MSNEISILQIIKEIGPAFKKSPDQFEFVEEFKNVIERTRKDILWNAEELNLLWPTLERFRLAESFPQIVEVALIEKLIRQVASIPSELQKWRAIFYNTDTYVQEQILNELKEHKDPDYLKVCESKMNSIMNEMVLEHIDNISPEYKEEVLKVRTKVLFIESNLFFNVAQGKHH